MGVRVDDREKTWSASGGGYSGGGGFGGGGFGGGGFGGAGGQAGHDYHREPDDRAPIDVAKVDDLLSQRVAAKRQRDFTSADALRDQLRSMGVEVQDREKTWRVGRGGGMGGGTGGGMGGGGGGGGMGSAPPPYRRDDDRSVPVDEAKINELTSQRVAAKFQRTPAPDLHRRTHRVRTARACAGIQR